MICRSCVASSIIMISAKYIHCTIQNRLQRRSTQCLLLIWRVIVKGFETAATNLPGNSKLGRLSVFTNDYWLNYKHLGDNNMCGIAGVVWSDRQRPSSVAEADIMATALYHRGPDDGEVFAEGSMAFAHRRLAIIDLSAAGRQPMLSGDESLVIVYNGEIYNYLEIREELRHAGHRFRSDTDTEVILEAY